MRSQLRFLWTWKKAVIKKVMKGSEARVCYMNVVTYVQFVIKCVYGSKELGCAKTRAATNGEKNEKEEHAKINAR